jgi:hypothetical protein
MNQGACKHLVSVLCLVAIAVTNVGGGAFASCPGPTPVLAPQSEAVVTAATREVTSCCCPSCHTTKPTPDPARSSPSDHTVPADGSRPRPTAPECPFCPGCPDGCCSNCPAKAPCLVPVADFFILTLAVQGMVAEVAPTLPPAVAGELFQPPRV